MRPVSSYPHFARRRSSDKPRSEAISTLTAKGRGRRFRVIGIAAIHKARRRFAPVSQGYNAGCDGNGAGLVLGGPRRPLRHPTRRPQCRDAPRTAFGDRPLIGRQGLRHALALLRSLLLRPVGPRRELLPLRKLLPLQHGVPLRPLYRDQSLHYALLH